MLGLALHPPPTSFVCEEDGRTYAEIFYSLREQLGFGALLKEEVSVRIQCQFALGFGFGFGALEVTKWLLRHLSPMPHIARFSCEIVHQQASSCCSSRWEGNGGWEVGSARKPPPSVSPST